MGLLEYRSFGISGEDADICIDLIEGMFLPWDVRGRDWIVPRLDGRTEGNRRKDTLILPLAGVIKGSGVDPTDRLEDFAANVEAVMAVMDPSLASGTLTASAGYLGLPVGSQATIECRVLNAGPGEIQSYRSNPFQLWTFELEALAGDWVVGS